MAIKNDIKITPSRSGFTLIEIMLVILVVALMTLYAVRVINQSILNSEVSRAANQITSIRQAVLAFYAANDLNWPPQLIAITQNIGANQYNNPSSIPQLLPPNGLCSPFASNTSTSQCATTAPYQGSFSISNNMQSYYTLSVQTPSSTIANALIASLPNASVSNSTVVNVAIPLPAQISGQANHGWIVSAGVISTLYKQGSNSYWNQGSQVGTQVFLPNCGPGYEGHIIFSPERYQTNSAGRNWGMHLAQTKNNGSKGDSTQISTDPNQSIIFNTTSKDEKGNTAYATTYADSPDANTTSTQHLAFYLTFCLPIGHWGTHWVNSVWLQDAECSTSWQQYLSHQGNPDPQCHSMDNMTWSLTGPVNQSGSVAPAGSPDAY